MLSLHLLGREDFEPTARFEIGDATAIDAPDASHDVAVAALVVHFMPDPAKGITEMARVVKAGGLVSAYAWDMQGGGFPYEAMHRAMHSLDLKVPAPPHPEAADAAVLRDLWWRAGLVSVEERKFDVTQTFRDLDHYWGTATSAPRIAAGLAAVSNEVLAALRRNLEDMLQHTGRDGIAVSARANAVTGRVPSA